MARFRNSYSNYSRVFSRFDAIHEHDRRQKDTARHQGLQSFDKNVTSILAVWFKDWGNERIWAYYYPRLGAVVQLVEYRTRNRELAGSTHTRSAASNLEQVANLLCAQATSAS